MNMLPALLMVFKASATVGIDFLMNALCHGSPPSGMIMPVVITQA